ncbi:tripartite tricarboxylate transporter substrate binding protein [Telmatospirillum sp. J64-1]|uniref:Bug family tripartite tricarboxylate transporter substrate binding protein n=1 Tax=Telmatospirillum sp. J64-1 TaxID=2502183 RepID=UPI00163DBAE4|nr:tripartite tricarboxylate transporter substrate binding protein [Telmatospirillum sp. J64-1]
MLRKICGLALAALTASVVSTVGASAQYPERSVTIVVPFSAGGNTDVIARVIADHLTEELGQPVVIENRGGGGGTIGTRVVAKAKPDGYTLLFGVTGTHSVNPNLREVGYDPLQDFAPVSVAVISSVLMVVHPSVEAQNLEELIALTSSSSGSRLNFASGGVGTVAHVAGELFNERTGSSLAHIPYKGAGDALNDVVAGRIQVYMNNIPAILPHVTSGTLRPLALASATRSKLLPDVPTTQEAGLEDFEMGSWYGLLAPAGTPDDVIARLHEAMTTMVDSEKVNERLAALGSEPTVSESPEAFGEYIKGQLDWWKEVLDRPAFH